MKIILISKIINIKNRYNKCTISIPNITINPPNISNKNNPNHYLQSLLLNCLPSTFHHFNNTVTSRFHLLLHQLLLIYILLNQIYVLLLIILTLHHYHQLIVFIYYIR